MTEDRTDKLRIAVQFFGHLRTFEKCAQSVRKHLLDKYDCDVFMHTWDKTEHTTRTWHENKSKIREVDEEMQAKIQHLYQLKALLVEKQEPAEDISIEMEHDNGQTKISTAGLRYMLTSLKKTDELRCRYAEENNVKYDYVITLRPDIFLKKTFDFGLLKRESQVLPDLPWRFYAVNPDASVKNFAFASDLASDIITIAKPGIMTKSIEVLNTVVHSRNLPPVWCPENLFLSALAQNGIISVPLAYYCRTDWQIERSGNYKKMPFYKKIIRLSLHKGKFNFHLFAGLNFSIFRLGASIGGKNVFEIKVGRDDG